MASKCPYLSCCTDEDEPCTAEEPCCIYGWAIAPGAGMCCVVENFWPPFFYFLGPKGKLRNGKAVGPANIKRELLILCSNMLSNVSRCRHRLSMLCFRKCGQWTEFRSSWLVGGCYHIPIAKGKEQKAAIVQSRSYQSRAKYSHTFSWAYSLQPLMAAIRRLLPFSFCSFRIFTDSQQLRWRLANLAVSCQTPFTPRPRVRRGCILAPMLFCLAIVGSMPVVEQWTLDTLTASGILIFGLSKPAHHWPLCVKAERFSIDKFMTKFLTD